MKEADRVEQACSPIFSEDAGARMALVRMKMKLDQGEVGDLLGISQQQVSKLENSGTGHRRRKRGNGLPTFTLARFRAVFGKWANYILFGTGGGELNPAVIHQAYWEHRLKIRRKPGSGSKRTHEGYSGKNGP